MFSNSTNSKLRFESLLAHLGLPTANFMDKTFNLKPYGSPVIVTFQQNYILRADKKKITSWKGKR